MTANDIRHAIDRVSQWGGAGDVAADRAEADRIVAAVRALPRADLFALLTAAGFEGARRADSKPALLRRLELRLTARARATERAEC